MAAPVRQHPHRCWTTPFASFPASLQQRRQPSRRSRTEASPEARRAAETSLSCTESGDDGLESRDFLLAGLSAVLPGKSRSQSSVRANVCAVDSSPSAPQDTLRERKEPAPPGGAYRRPMTAHQPDLGASSDFSRTWCSDHVGLVTVMARTPRVPSRGRRFGPVGDCRRHPRGIGVEVIIAKRPAVLPCESWCCRSAR